MEDGAEPSASTSNEDSTAAASQNNDTPDVPEAAIPDEILRDVGAQNIFRTIMSNEESKIPGKYLS